MTTLYEKAFAKLNLTLDVLGKRDDGYHDLKSVMQTVSLRDDIVIEMGTQREWELECTASAIPVNESNLAWKAAKAFCDALQKDPHGLKIRIEKRIPSGAGMGGGSADAAAVLRALNRYYGEPLSVMELADLGAKIGSDVPFCVLGGTAMAEGRGERLRVLPQMQDCIIVGCKPEFSVSTPELYRKIDAVTIPEHPDNDAMERALRAGDLNGICAQIFNVFDPVVSRDHPEIREIRQIFAEHGALAHQMTGSGSVVFAVMPGQKEAEAACEALREKYAEVFIVRPV